jgi:UDP-N-acetylmuramate--alanine ligase
MALLIILNFDHPDFFPDEKSYIKVFSDFIKKIPSQGFLIANHGDKNLRKITSHCKGRVISYDVEIEKDKADYVAYDLEMRGGRQFFKLAGQGTFSIRLLGKHNVLMLWLLLLQLEP